MFKPKTISLFTIMGKQFLNRLNIINQENDILKFNDPIPIFQYHFNNQVFMPFGVFRRVFPRGEHL